MASFVYSRESIETDDSRLTKPGGFYLTKSAKSTKRNRDTRESVGYRSSSLKQNMIKREIEREGMRTRAQNQQISLGTQRSANQRDRYCAVGVVIALERIKGEAFSLG